MKIIIVNHSKNIKLPISARDLQILIEKIRHYFLLKKVRNKVMLKLKKELTIVFLSKAKMQKINKQFRKKDKPTDILSFTGQDSQSLGELILCLDILKKQAIDQKHSLKNEITYMLIHGILHLLGYDHEVSLQEEKRMFKLQDHCFAELGKGLNEH